jgi:hypothetical protein
MLSTRYLIDHIEALIRLSHEIQDRAVSAKLRDIANELRIMVSVADISDLAAELKTTSSIPASQTLNEAVAAKPKRKRKKYRASGAASPKPKRKAKKKNKSTSDRRPATSSFRNRSDG